MALRSLYLPALLPLLLLGSVVVCLAESQSYEPANACESGACRRAPLRFKADGTFKILQVADVHYKNKNIVKPGHCKDLTDAQKLYPCGDSNSTALLAGLIERERPDLVVFTGDNDILDGPPIKDDPNVGYLESMRQLVQPLVDAGVPWMTTFGNHDCEGFITTCRSDIVDQEQTLWPDLSYTKHGPADVDGVTNYAYTIAGSTDGKPKFALYVLDGGAYAQYGPRGPSGYDFIRPSQVKWYNDTAQGFKKRYGAMPPAVLFAHMPLPEYDTAWTCQFTDSTVYTDGLSNRNPSIADFGPGKTLSGMGLRWVDSACSASGANVVGVKQEGSYSAKLNAGLFSAMVMNGDVKMMNVGHDHVDDFCATMGGVRLCYGGGFGYHAYNTPGFARRARVIELRENGQIRTWKRLDQSLGNWQVIDVETF